MDYKLKIENIGKLLNFINSNNNFSDTQDIRNITVDAFAQNAQNYFIALNLAENLNDINFVQNQISTQFLEEDLEIVNFNFDGFMKDAFFIRSFILFENHIRQIASFYESSTNDLNKTSINSTIRNITDQNKLSIINVSQVEIEILIFFCYLRNTMHNFGFQTQLDKQIIISDSSSVISKSTYTLKLDQLQANKNMFIEFILLIEQIFKILIKINSQIPTTDKIEHRLNTLGY